MIAYRNNDDYKNDASRYIGGIAYISVHNIEDICSWCEDGIITEDAEFEIIEPKQLPAPNATTPDLLSPRD